MNATPLPVHVDALLVVDMQRAFFAGEPDAPHARDLLARIEELLARARGAGVPVALVQNDGPPGSLDEVGEPGWALAVSRRDEDVVSRKSLDDAFLETDLASRLRDRAVDSVAITGVHSEMCVAATARGAMAAGFTVVMPHDGHASFAVPGWEGIAAEVPAEVVSRVAEWSLGDQVSLVPRTTDIAFGNDTRTGLPGLVATERKQAGTQQAATEASRIHLALTSGADIDRDAAKPVRTRRCPATVKARA